MPPEPVSIVVLTKDEAANIGECLDALVAQLAPGDEVIVVDAASTDGTIEIACRYESRHPDAVRVLASDELLSFGAARNIGIKLAHNEIVAFVSADAVPEADWLEALRSALVNADIVYGRQRHAPPAMNVATVSRGLRYHHFEIEDDGLPERYASNVNAAYRKLVFDDLAFDERASGAEDVAFAKEARFAGYRIAYAKQAIVRHKDVTDWRGEWRKNVREGRAYAELRKLLGAPVGHLAWAFAVGGIGLLAIYFESVVLLAGTTALFFAPALRRLVSPVARNYSPSALLAGAFAAPIFDFAFLAGYLRRRVIP